MGSRSCAKGCDHGEVTSRSTSTEPTSTTEDPVAGDEPVRLRYSRTAYVPLIIAASCALPFAIGLRSWGLLVLVPFVLVGIALARCGADITAEEVILRGAVSSTRVARSDLEGFVVPDERHVHLLRLDGSSVRIPTARPRDLPMLRTLLFGHPAPVERVES